MKNSIRTSSVLQQLIDEKDSGTVALSDIVDTLRDRGLAMAMFIFALPNCIPFFGMTGLSVVVGIPILFFALQMLAGRHSIWLPRALLRKRFSKTHLCRALAKIIPAIVWLERFLRPRLSTICVGWPRRILALLFTALALLIAMPIPGGNLLPGVLLCFMLLALMEEDGVVVLLGVALTLGVGYSFYEVIGSAWERLFG